MSSETISNNDLSHNGLTMSDLKPFFSSIAAPSAGIVIFLLLWAFLAPKVVTSLGAVPGPQQVYSQFTALVGEHKTEREKEVAFYKRQDDRNAKEVG